MAGYNLGTNTIGFYKFSKTPINSSIQSINESIKYNSITGSTDNMGLFALLAYYNNGGHWYGNISNFKYKSRPYSLYTTFTESDKIYSTVAILNKDEKFNYLISNQLKNQPILILDRMPSYGIIERNEWTIDFWAYPRLSVVTSSGVGMAPLFHISGSAAPYQFKTTNLELSAKQNPGKKQYRLSDICIFYSDKLNDIKNYIYPGSSNSNYFISFSYRYYYSSNGSSASGYSGSIAFPIDIKLNSWNHIAMINSIENGPLIAINGKVKKLIPDYTSDMLCVIENYDCRILLNGRMYNTASESINGSMNIEMSSYIVRNTSSPFVVTTVKDPFITNSLSHHVQVLNANEVQSFTHDIFFDDVRTSQSALWTEDFTPPGLIGKQFFVYDGYAYYNNENNEISKLSFVKWEDISESDKLTLLERVEYNDFPSAEQIKLVQTDPSKDIVCYNYQTDTIKPSLKIEKIDQSRSEIVYPTKFLDYGSIQDYILNIKATGSTNDTSNIRLAITRDGETYYTYNATNVAWVPLDNRSDVRTSGILLDSLDDIPASSWKQFGLDKFAFSISLSKMNENDPCQINDITLSISLDEKWVKANKTTQVKYKYVGPTLLKVNLLEEGKYRINYNDRG